MSEDIRSKLLSSDAFQSLQMEGRVANILRLRDWPANQSAYYRDSSTQKIREVDVHSMRTFASKEDPQQVVINFHIFAECKNLNSQHLLFLGDPPPPPGRASDWWSDGLRLDMYWLGHELDDQFIGRFAEALGLQAPAQYNALYKYISERSHPSQRALIRPSFINLPVVDVVSRGFRETNTRETRDESSSVIWGTILSLQSALDEARRRALQVSKELIFEVDHKGAIRGSADHIDTLCYFLDSELCRLVYLHPVIVTRSRLWNTQNGIEEVKSVRLVIGQTDFQESYIDIVADDAVEQYLQSATALFEQMAKNSIKRMRKDMRELGWSFTSEKRRLIALRKKTKTAKGIQRELRSRA